MNSELSAARLELHRQAFDRLIRVNAAGVPSFADKSSLQSSRFATGVAQQAADELAITPMAGQTAGSVFEELIRDFLQKALGQVQHLRPARLRVTKGGRIDQFAQYSHLHEIEALSQQHPGLSAAMGGRYLIKPDVVVAQSPYSDGEINAASFIVADSSATRTVARSRNNGLPLLHACVSCKYTIRSDRVQNARAEALTLMRNRKGRAPHIVVVTVEPLPSRLASIALGTGDIDCVYHLFLDELIDVVASYDDDRAERLLETMTTGQRLRDIADLPLDLLL